VYVSFFSISILWLLFIQMKTHDLFTTIPDEEEKEEEKQLLQHLK
jgi:hypothetical protein